MVCNSMAWPSRPHGLNDSKLGVQAEAVVTMQVVQRAPMVHRLGNSLEEVGQWHHSLVFGVVIGSGIHGSVEQHSEGFCAGIGHGFSPWSAGDVEVVEFAGSATDSARSLTGELKLLFKGHGRRLRRNAANTGSAWSPLCSPGHSGRP